MPVRPILSADFSALSASEAMRRWSGQSERPRILLVARWPIGAVRAHLLANYSAVCSAGHRVTLVGPKGEALERLREDFEEFEELECVSAPVEERRCRLWPTVRSLLRSGQFGLLHSHGITAAVHAALANLGIGIPHLVTLHKPLRPNQFPGWAGCLKRWMLKRALQQADAIVTASAEARANLLEHVPCLRDGADRLLTIAGDIRAERLIALLRSMAMRTLLTSSSEPIAA